MGAANLVLCELWRFLQRMKRIKPLLIVRFNSAVLSGGRRRTYEMLRHARAEGIDYIVMTDSQSCANATKIFPSWMRTLSNYKVYMDSYAEDALSAKGLRTRVPGLRQALFYKNLIKSALSISRVALEEDVDLIIGGSEDMGSSIRACIAGNISRKPWTIGYSGTSDITHPLPMFDTLNAINILKFVSHETKTKGIELISRIGLAFELFLQLKIAEKPLMLTVSSSIKEDFNYIDPRIKFHVINPGNGINLESFAMWRKRAQDREYDAIFFARLVPEKGLYELPAIWKLVTEKVPKAKLAVAGVVEDKKFVDDFKKMITKYDLDRNVVFLGQLDMEDLRHSIRSSRLTLNPSRLDAFSLVTLESLACGVPVIAYDIPAIRYNFGRCDSVFRCPLKDNRAMAEKALMIMEEETLRKTLAKKAIEYSANYSWPNVARAEKEAYFKVIEHFTTVN
jgi:glycosyltransferase involved in cell wall biosynthesis